MRKRVLFILLCIFMLGASFSRLNATNSVQTKNDSGGGYVVWEPLILDPGQLSANNIDTGMGDLSYLIDGNTNTILHSVWHNAMKNPDITEEEWLAVLQGICGGVNTDAGYHNLQVKLNDPVKEFIFEYKGRNTSWHDNPNHIAIYATNSYGLASTTTNKDQDKWTFIKELTPENGNFPGDVLVIAEPYRSELIEMPKAFKYIRFVIKGSTHEGTHVDRTFAKREVTGVTYNISEFQLYTPKKTEDYTIILPNVIDSITNVESVSQITIGKDPGYTDSLKYDRYFQILEKCQNAMIIETDNEVLKGYCKELRDVFADLIQNGVLPIETGYYFIENCYPGYMSNQGVTKSMCVTSDGKFGWETTNHENGMQLWYIEKLENGNFSIRNIAANLYIGGIDGLASKVPLTKTHQIDQLFRPETSVTGQFHLYNVANDIEYHTEGHGNGKGNYGPIVTWTGGANSASSWRLRHVTDQKLIDKLVGEGDNAVIKAGVERAIVKARAVQSKMFDYKELLTDASQISSNAQSGGDGSSIWHLLDGNTNTIFHSVWSESFKQTAELGESYGWHNLQFRLDKSVTGIRFHFIGRYHSGNWRDTPDHITIYGTNVDSLGASTAAADSLLWDELVDMTKDKYNFPGNVNYAEYNSPDIDFGGKSYKYLRFVVKHTSGMAEGGNRYGWFASPQATGITFNLSEFQMWPLNADSTSQYYTVPGIKEACDAIDALILTAQENINAGNPKQEDIDKLEAAALGLDTMYVDRPTIHRQLTSLLATAEEYCNKATGSRQSLIKDASQLDANSVLGGSVGDLLDGNINSCLHTVWDAAMKDPELTVDEWETVLSDRYQSSYGAGYHNLQVALDAPQKAFYFEFKGRNNGEWHDNPDHIVVYATNDADLASDIRDNRTSEWTKITELTNENAKFPGDVMITEAPYVSPVIDMKTKYKYVRFVVKHSSHMGAHTDRTFSNPDITGVTWNLSEFQMYAQYDPENIQYNYIEDVKIATDELQSLVDKYKDLTLYEVTSSKPVDDLEAAVDKLLKAYVDTNEVVRVYNKYKNIIANTEEGDVVGCIDDYEVAVAFGSVLDEARALISPDKPTKQQVDEAMAKIDAANKEFLSHINMVEPYVWYNIKSAAANAFADQPIFLAGLGLGSDLRVGGYDGDASFDVYAIWRLVPIEGVEGQFAIQNLGTGQYFGPYRGNGTGYHPLMSHEKTPYVVEYCGHQAFNIRQADVEDKENHLKADGTNKIVLNWPSNHNNEQEWRFANVLDNTDMVNINWYPENNVNIITLPWANKGESALSVSNVDIETYGINNVVSTSSEGTAEGKTVLTLTAKDEFEAGEPIVLVTKAGIEGNGRHPLSFVLPAAEANAVVDSSSIVANGLVGTLQGVRISGAASLFFEASVLKICGDAPKFIEARGGWIDASQVTDLQGSIDKTITIGGMINNVENIVVEDANALVNVYTIDGVMVKQNVKAADAVKNLAKGIYVVGKKKVLVR